MAARTSRRELRRTRGGLGGNGPSRTRVGPPAALLKARGQDSHRRGLWGGRAEEREGNLPPPPASSGPDAAPDHPRGAAPGDPIGRRATNGCSRRRSPPLTPHRVARCAAVRAYVEAAGRASTPGNRAARRRLALCLLQEHEAHDGFVEPSLAEFLRSISGAIETRIDDFAEQVASQVASFESPNDLFEFFQSLRDLLHASFAAREEGLSANVLIVYNSTSGHFLRRSIIAFDSLPFEAICQLLIDLKAYSLDKDASSPQEMRSIDDHLPINTEDTWAVELGHEGASQQELAVQGLGLSDDRSTRLQMTKGSRKFLKPAGQLEAALEAEARAIQKQPRSASKAGLEEKLKELLRLNPGASKAHYLHYLHSRHYKDYAAASHNLHRYFDYSAGHTGSTGDGNVGQFQTALLELGCLHTEFGHAHEAMQNNDETCLAHALASLCHLLLESPASTAMSASSATSAGDKVVGIPRQLLLLLRRCLARAMELNIPHLVAFARLALATSQMQYPSSHSALLWITMHGLLKEIASPQALRETAHLLEGTAAPQAGATSSGPILLGVGSSLTHTATSASRSFQVNASASQSGGSILSGWGQVAARAAPLLETGVRLAGCSHLLKATSWELYGSTPMARLGALVHATCYQDVARADDLCTSYVKLAKYVASQNGYKAAAVALEVALKKFSLPANRRLRVCQLELLHDRSLHRGRLRLAEEAVMELSALVSATPGSDMELRVAVGMRSARNLLASDDLPGAADLAEKLLADCVQSHLQLELVQVLILSTNIHKQAGSPISALPYALNSVTLSQSLSLDMFEAAAVVLVAELWLAMGPEEAARSSQLLTCCLPLILAHGDLELRGNCHLALAKCRLISLEESRAGKLTVCVILPVLEESAGIVELLSVAAHCFEALEARAEAAESYYLMALTYNAMDDAAARDVAAEKSQWHTQALQEARADLLATSLD
eukprot:SM000034S12666  [mRNA]  locus=s34:73792:80686:- [translate_table: standard]